MSNLQKATVWKKIEKLLTLIPDPILRNTIKYEFQQKAIEDWGFCPAETLIKKDKEDKIPELEPWEQEIYDRIQGYIQYGVDIRTQDDKQKLHNQTLNNMIEFINMGGTYLEIPESIRCDSLKRIYDEAFYIAFDINKGE